MRRVFRSLVIMAITTLAVSASAQEAPVLGTKGQFVVGAERLFGFYSWSQESSANGITAKVQGSNFSFLWGASTTSGGGAAPGATPRLAFDYVAFDVPVTLGATFGYASGSGTQDLPTGTGTTTTHSDLPDSSAWAIGARVGYVVRLNEKFSLWPRVGVTYQTSTRKTTTTTGATSTTSETTIKNTSLNLEGYVVFEPISHVGFMLGPFFDVPLGGSASVTNSSVSPDVKTQAVGVTAGVLVYF